MVDSVPGNVGSTIDVAVGTVVLGTIETISDHDWYRLTLTAGQRYSFATSFGGGSANFDTEIVLRDASGAVIVRDDDSGPGTYSLLGYTATQTGTFFLDVGAFNDRTTGTFKLAVSSTAPPPGDIAAGDVGTTASIALGASVNGTIDAIGDHDWYRVTLSAGQSYQIRTNATSGSADPDTTISIRDANGNELAFNDDGTVGTYSSLRFTASTSGTYYIDVSTYGEAETGAFSLTLAEAPPLTVYTNDQIAFQLTDTYWGGGQHRFNVAAGGTLSVNVTGLATDGVALAREALGLWRDATGVNFSEVSSGGQIVIDDNEAGAFTAVSSSNGISSAARVNIGTQWLADYGNTVTTYGFQAYVHEIGHALGLGHAGDYNSVASYPADASYLNDNWSTSIMSYFSQTENGYSRGLGYSRQYQLTPTAADDIAASNLYGPVTTTRTGDTSYGYGSNAGSAVFNAAANLAGGYVIIDNGGIDTLNYSMFAGLQVINLTPEAMSSVTGGVGNVSIARGSIIENAIGGGGNDVLQGNYVANVLAGNIGNDTLLGLGGADTLIGGSGNDIYGVDLFDDLVVEARDEGLTDIVYAAASFALSAAAEIEQFAGATAVSVVGLTLTGNAFGQAIAGTYGNDTISGGGATINGGDILIGLRGDDLYYVDALSTLLIEDQGEGIDAAIILASASNFILNAASGYVEVLSAASGSVAINVTGNALSQTINGNDGDNVLSAGGGAPDTLNGALGNDVYRLYGGADVITDTGGIDTIYTSGSYRLNGGAAIEIMSAAVQVGTEGISLVGNETAQMIIGNYGANVLDGRGGNDTLIGLDGSDIYAFTSVLGVGNVDTVQGFVSGTDKIGLAADIFANVLTGGVTAGEFLVGISGSDADDRLIYDQGAGRLFYDADAEGAGAAILFAQLAAGVLLTPSDFITIVPMAA